MTKEAVLSSLMLPLALSSGTLAPEKVVEHKVVQAALDSIEMCYHWAEENGGGGGVERQKDIHEGIERDCRVAKRRATRAYKLFPSNGSVSLGILKLNDIGFFELSEREKKRLCERGAPLFRNGFFRARHQDAYFRAFCPEHVIEEQKR
jgi:hypothetical protein